DAAIPDAAVPDAAVPDGAVPEPVEIAPAPLTSPTAQALIAALDADLAARYPDPADVHPALSVAEVTGDSGVFLVATVAGEPVGCGAPRQIAPGTGEIKRMYVAPSHRGRGLGNKLLAELERHARRLGLSELVLETGAAQPEALGLYRRAGFTGIPRFGAYRDSPASICLGKSL